MESFDHWTLINGTFLQLVNPDQYKTASHIHISFPTHWTVKSLLTHSLLTSRRWGVSTGGLHFNTVVLPVRFFMTVSIVQYAYRYWLTKIIKSKHSELYRIASSQFPSTLSVLSGRQACLISLFDPFFLIGVLLFIRVFVACIYIYWCNFFCVQWTVYTAVIYILLSSYCITGVMWENSGGMQ